MTEDEARKKWCPMAASRVINRKISDDEQEQVILVSDGKLNVLCVCG